MSHAATDAHSSVRLAHSSTCTVSPTRHGGTFCFSPTYAPVARGHKSPAIPSVHPSERCILDTSCPHTTVRSRTFGLLPSSQHGSLWELKFQNFTFLLPQ